MTESSGIKSDFSKLFETCEEIPKPVLCSVTGVIPEWLTGTLLRNGPGMFSVGATNYNHLFDGLALLQRFRIENGLVQYSCRYLKSKAYQKNMSAKRIVVSEFGTMSHLDPCKNIFSRYLSYFFPYSMTDNDAINFVTARDQVFAATELPTWHRVDQGSLTTKNKVSNIAQIVIANMKQYVAINTLTAHPHYDQLGNIYNLGSGIGSYKIFKTDVSKKYSRHAMEHTKVIASIPMQHCLQPSYYHSFGMSENFAIFPEMPLTLNVTKLLTSRFRQKTFSDAMEWHEEQMTRFHIIRLIDGQQTGPKYFSDPFFTFHHVNAFERDDCLVVDFCAFESGKLITQFKLSELRQGRLPTEKAYLTRVVIPLHLPKGAKIGENLLQGVVFAGDCQAIVQQDGASIFLVSEQIVDTPFELPRINYEKANGRPYRFVYGSALQENEAVSLVKVDVINKSILTWSAGSQSLYAGEPVFIARADSCNEDDGVVVCPVMSNCEEEFPFLLFLNGESFQEIARATLPATIPFGFHSIFLSDNEKCVRGDV